MKITNKEMSELEKISYDIACYVTHEHNKHDIRSLREFIENRILESELNKTNDIHSVSGSFLCGHDQHGYRKCHEQCGECKEQQKIDKIYCEDCGDWAGCDNEDCQYFKGNDR